MITRFIIVLMIVYARVKGDCTIDTTDKRTGKLHEKIQKWSIYKKTFTLKNDSTVYQIGICQYLAIGNKTNSGVVQEENHKSFVLGRIDRVRLFEGDGWTQLTYENGDSFENRCENRQRSVSLMFICGKNSNSPKILQENTEKDSSCFYAFQFEVAEICANDTPIAKKSLSGGAIFLIILLSVASAYLIGGFLFMRIQRGARGIDQIPNLDFWRRFGNLAADGCDFCCRCNTTNSRAGYFLDESGPDLRGGDDDILSP